MTLDILDDKEGRYYTIEGVNNMIVGSPSPTLYGVIYGKKIITTIFGENHNHIKSEQNDTGLGIVPGMIVMSNKSEPKASWDMNSKADMIKMCNQVKLLMGLEEV
jgi:hypothetical protein